jgi:hypothetical protein
MEAAIEFATRKGTPLPIVLNMSEILIVFGSSNSFGKDCIAKASAAESLLAL